MLESAYKAAAQRYFFSSSACVYPPTDGVSEVVPLKEADAYPADPEEGYGWEKIYAEKLCQYDTEEEESHAGRPFPQHLWAPRHV